MYEFNTNDGQTQRLANAKYADLTATHVFMPIAIETAGSWNQQAIEVIEDIERRISSITKETLETIHLFQRISVAIQRGNALSFMSTFDDDYEAIPTTLTVLNISVCRLCAGGRKK